MTDDFLEHCDKLLGKIVEKLDRGKLLQRRLDALAPKWEVLYKAKVNEWFAFQKKQIVKDLNKKFVKAADPIKIVTHFTDWDFIEKQGEMIIKPLSLDIIRESGDEAWRVAGIQGSFDVVNTEAVRLANSITAKMVADVTAKTKEGIAQAISHGIAEGNAMSTVAKDIQPLIGLTGRDVGAVDSYKKFLQAKVPASSASVITKKVDYYTRKLHTKRAKLIATTETARAQSEGTLEGYMQGGVKRAEWVTAAGACPLCDDLNGSKFTIEEAQGMQPLHPSCRCTWVSVEEARKPKPEVFTSIPESKWGAFGKNNIQFSSKLTKDDFVGIDNYIGNNLSFYMNGLLRGNKEVIKRVKDSELTSIFNNFNNKLSVAIDKSKLTSNIKAYRGVSDKFPVLKIGDEVVDKGFTSLSLDIDHASSFMPKGGRLLEVKVSKGTKAFFDKTAQDNKLWNPQKLKIPEKELVLQKGAKLRFIETFTRPDGWEVDVMELIK